MKSEEENQPRTQSMEVEERRLFPLDRCDRNGLFKLIVNGMIHFQALKRVAPSGPVGVVPAERIIQTRSGKRIRLRCLCLPCGHTAGMNRYGGERPHGRN